MLARRLLSVFGSQVAPPSGIETFSYSGTSIALNVDTNSPASLAFNGTNLLVLNAGAQQQTHEYNRTTGYTGVVNDIPVLGFGDEGWISISASSTKVWLGDIIRGKVVQLNEATYTLEETLYDGIEVVRGVAHDGDLVWILEAGTNNILYSYDLNTSTLSAGIVLTGLDSPRDMTAIGDYLYIIDASIDAIAIYAKDGTYTGTSISVASQASNPFGVVYDGLDLWVLDDTTDAIYKFNSDNPPPPSPPSLSIASTSGSINSPSCETVQIDLTTTVTGGEVPYTYVWEKISGAGSLLLSATSKNNSVVITDVCPQDVIEGVYRCTVTDGNGNTGSDTVVLEAFNSAPIISSRDYTWKPFAAFVPSQASPASRGFRARPNLSGNGALSEIAYIDENLDNILVFNTGELFSGGTGTEWLAKWNGGAWSDYELQTTLEVFNGSVTTSGIFSTRTLTLTGVSDLNGSLDCSPFGSTYDVGVDVVSTHIPTGETRIGRINLISY